MRWYGSQLYRVRWGDLLSDGFTSTNGVAQGGILSPRFFNDLSVALSNSKYGCTFGGCSVNHLSYADDMVILSPSATALQKLLDIWLKSTKSGQVGFEKIDFSHFSPRSMQWLFQTPGVSIVHVQKTVSYNTL